MDPVLPPDPYKALGVTKDATAAAIKTQYRKLVLKFHPDKVNDQAQKQEAADQFHRVQTAWEIVGDEKRRARYDAQCKLAELRRDVLGGGGAPDVRTASFKVPTDSARGGDFYARGPERSGRMSPQYEERRPGHVPQDYFDIPRSSARKDADYERSSKPSKRAPPREEHKKSKSSSKGTKENERSSRKEKSRRMEQDTRRDRDRKYAYVSVEEENPSSDSDAYERFQRMRDDDEMRVDPELRRAKEAFARDAQRKREEAEAGMYYNERAQKLFTQEYMARDYIASRGRQAAERERERPSSERRPSPVRNQSSRDKVEFIERRGQSPVRIRRGSGRPKTTENDTDRRKSSSREKDTRPTVEVMEEPDDVPRRPPPLNHSNSSPPEVRIQTERTPGEKARSHSLQEDVREPPIPKIRRADSAPYSPTTGPTESRRKDSSKLRTAEAAYLTPEASPEPPLRKYSYGREYADDREFPTPDGYQTSYQTEYREPVEPTLRPRNLSSSPPKESRERQRSASARYPSQPQPTKRYFYGDAGEPRESQPRPPISRENSGPARLFGEVPTTSRSPRPTQKFSPPPEEILYSRKPTPQDVKATSGYKVRRGSDRINTSSKQNPIYVR